LLEPTAGFPAVGVAVKVVIEIFKISWRSARRPIRHF
jgi:hypothetical protein